MNPTEMVFEEWKTYAGKKTLKKRALDLSGLISNSRLKIIGITGIRRSGKSSILIMLQKSISGRYGVYVLNERQDRLWQVV